MISPETIVNPKVGNCCQPKSGDNKSKPVPRVLWSRHERAPVVYRN